jgi:hypothetical protein
MYQFIVGCFNADASYKQDLTGRFDSFVNVSQNFLSIYK